MTADESTQTTETVRRDPDYNDDLPAIVRFHGANEVIDALMDVAVEAYGPEVAVEKVHALVLQRAIARAYPPAVPKHEHDGSGCIECACNAAPWSANDCTCPGGFS